MIVGLGIDLVQVEKIARNLEGNPGFKAKTFSPQEVNLCERLKNSSERFAGKFAAKEAFMKAIGAGIRQEIWFSQIEVLNHPSGEPYIITTGKAQEIFQSLGTVNIHLSISHTSGFAIALVILDKSEL
jgi:holo-[acyl-carrier protein] synthase